MDTATIGGGCFWCLEAVFEPLRGVEKVVSGYTGGKTLNPTYEQVCDGNTGHAEVIQVTFNPDQIGFADLLDVFFTLHDPTTKNRQGADVGTQYRSVIFYNSPEQQAVAQKKIAEIQAAGIWHTPLVTEVAPLPTFYPAEDYHQGYYRGNPRQPYCAAVISPKLAKLRKSFLAKLKDEQVG